MGLLRRGRGCHFGTRAISLAWCCHAVQSQDAECQSSGAPCCALKYSGARNFFNEQDLRCEEVADDCSSSQEYDPQVNKCIDVNSALSSVTEAPTTTARSSSSGGAASSGCENCCGHGTVDPSDSTLCVCEPGWTSSALLGKCSVQVEVTTTGAAESKSSSFDYSFDFTFSSLFGQWASSTFAGSRLVLHLLLPMSLLFSNLWVLLGLLLLVLLRIRSAEISGATANTLGMGRRCRKICDAAFAPTAVAAVTTTHFFSLGGGNGATLSNLENYGGQNATTKRRSHMMCSLGVQQKPSTKTCGKGLNVSKSNTLR